MRYTVLAALMIVAAAFSRLIPHPLNFAPITAIALAGGVYLDKRVSILVPVAALVISDWILGFYPVLFFVYGSVVAIGFIGLWLRSHKKLVPVAGASLASSILFFLVTNFGVWAIGPEMYPRTWAGLADCYAAGIPFFRNTVTGDLFYVAVLFGLFELLGYLLGHQSATQKQAA
ncbi:MAG TPA: DUF6580 family putative transport protein [Bacteroidota bacterium]|nr:DUF6580 family putative transport protein [Bacteroidota bacterium]